MISLTVTILFLFFFAAALTIFCHFHCATTEPFSSEGWGMRRWLPLFAQDDERKGCYYEMLPGETACVAQPDGEVPVMQTAKHNVTQQPGLPVRNCVYASCVIAKEGASMKKAEEDRTVPAPPNQCGEDEVFALDVSSHVKNPPGNGGAAVVVVPPAWKLTIKDLFHNMHPDTSKPCHFPDANAKWIWHSATDSPACVLFQRSFIADYEEPPHKQVENGKPYWHAGWLFVACDYTYSVCVEVPDTSEYNSFFHTGNSLPGTCDANYWAWPMRKLVIVKFYVQDLFPDVKKKIGFVLALGNMEQGLLLRSDDAWTWSVCEKPTPAGTVLKRIPEGSDASCHDVCADNALGGCLKAYGERDGVDTFCRNKKDQRVWCDCNPFVWPKSAENVVPTGPDVIVYTNPRRPSLDTRDIWVHGWIDAEGSVQKFLDAQKSPDIGGFGGRYAKVVPNGIYKDEEWVYYVQSVYIPSGKHVEIKYDKQGLVRPFVQTLSGSSRDLYRDLQKFGATYPLLNTQDTLMYFKVY